MNKWMNQWISEQTAGLGPCERRLRQTEWTCERMSEWTSEGVQRYWPAVQRRAPRADGWACVHHAGPCTDRWSCTSHGPGESSPTWWRSSSARPLARLRHKNTHGIFRNHRLAVYLWSNDLLNLCWTSSSILIIQELSKTSAATPTQLHKRLKKK